MSSASLTQEEFADRQAERDFRLQLVKLKIEAAKEEAAAKRAEAEAEATARRA